MTRALVTQMLEALLDDAIESRNLEQQSAIEAAREYLATEPSGDRAELIAEHQELNLNNYSSDDVEALNHWANRAHEMLEADAQQRSKPHGHCTHIKCREIWVAYLGALQKLSKYESGTTMHLNKEP